MRCFAGAARLRPGMVHDADRAAHARRVDRVRLCLHTRRVVAALVLALLLGGATARAEGGARRIVSLAPNLTELLFAAGAGGRVVGATEYSDYPAAARAIPRIGDAFRVDYERVLALRPDLVVAWESGTPPEVVGRLMALGLRVVTVRTATLEDVGATLSLLGRESGTVAAAEAARTAYDARLAELRRRYRVQQPVRVFIEIGDQPLYTVSGRHLISRITNLCGGDNIFAGLPALAPAVDIEAVLARNPEVILVTDASIPDPAAAWGRFTRLAAVQSHNVLAVPGDLVARATPRALEGVAAVCATLESARRRLPAPGAR